MQSLMNHPDLCFFGRKYLINPNDTAADTLRHEVRQKPPRKCGSGVTVVRECYLVAFDKFIRNYSIIRKLQPMGICDPGAKGVTAQQL
jgi:hypothetical protein